MNIVFIVSTGGAVLNELLKHSAVHTATLQVVSDRNCGAIEKAEKHRIPVKVFSASGGDEFSQLLDDYFSDKNTIFISFYTRLLSAKFLNRRQGYVFNCHPSILPACKGMDGFGDTLRSNSLFIGCTLHEVNEEMDGGRSVIQCALPLDRSLEEAKNRHKVFLMQYYSTLQFLKWVFDGKLKLGKDWKISLPKYKASIFSPNLDIDFEDFYGTKNEL
ncbi:formyltransferase family protein [Rhodobacteraceae bacterium]|nr:formyltransferase family protein [Paracoccaceae bacterium]